MKRRWKESTSNRPTNHCQETNSEWREPTTSICRETIFFFIKRNVYFVHLVPWSIEGLLLLSPVAATDYFSNCRCRMLSQLASIGKKNNYNRNLVTKGLSNNLQNISFIGQTEPKRTNNAYFNNGLLIVVDVSNIVSGRHHIRTSTGYRSKFSNRPIDSTLLYTDSQNENKVIKYKETRRPCKPIY